MNRAARLSIALCVCSWLYSAGALADSMRCGSKLVNTGDSLYDVRSLCGEPAFVTRRLEYRTIGGFGPGIGASRTVEVAIEEWVYDFGPHSFVRHLLFEQGRLLTVVAGRRGQKKPD